jgi:anthranilate synthase component 1
MQTLTPEISEIKKQFGTHNIVPVFYEMTFDTYTPIHIYKAMSENAENSFILESVSDGDRWGRYSFVGANPKAELIARGKTATIKEGLRTSSHSTDNPIEFIKEYTSQFSSPNLPGMPHLTGGLIGYFSYDTVRYFEKTLTNIPTDDLDMPECHLFMYDELVCFDHLRNKCIIIINLYKEKDLEQQYENAEFRAKEIAAKISSYSTPMSIPKDIKKTISVKSRTTEEEFKDIVTSAKEYIKGGDIFQIVLSRRFEVENPPDSFNVYRCLRMTNPSPYLYYFKTKDYEIAGASPELLVSVTGDVVKTRPIAGTAARGKSDEEDKMFEENLRNDPKERAEHTMLVDLGRNDLGKVSEFSSVKVLDFMHTERYSKVMHLVTNVEGKLQAGKDSLDALTAVLPAGTLSGAPKVRAMELIDKFENTKRGLYGGTVGYIGFDGNMDTCIAIRTVLFKNGFAYVQSGAGIVADSSPEKEYEETYNKSLAMLNAIREADNL